MGTTWVFGYGSLVFRPGFAFLDRQRAVLPGHRRVFFQGSPDHRGTPDAPGRVVTLEPHAAGAVGGMCFLVAEDAFGAVIDALDEREQGGYVREVMQVHGDAGPLSAWVFYATPDNPHYLGPASPAAIAAHAHRATGPSGANREYVLRLAASLRDLGFDDAHVFAVERELLALGDAGG